MKIAVIQSIVGLLLMIFSSSMLPPALVGWWFGDGAIAPFLEAFVPTLPLFELEDSRFSLGKILKEPHRIGMVCDNQPVEWA